MNAPDLSYWTLNSCFDVFCTVWVHLGPFHRLTTLGSKQTELVRLMQKLMHEIVLDILVMNAPDPPYWTLNSYLGAFICVWILSGPFRRLTKLGSKWAELVESMQKFVP